MKLKQFASIGRRQLVYAMFLALGVGGCATTSDSNYAYRNNIDAARSRCVELARSSGFQEVVVDSIDRDAQASGRLHC